MTTATLSKKGEPEAKAFVKKKSLNPFVLWLVPIIGLMLIFTVIPIFASFFLSFTDYELNQPLKFIGIQNFIYAFSQDQVFLSTIANTIYYAFVSVPVSMVISLVVAQFIFNRKHLQSFFRTMYFLPYITPMIAVVVVWRFLLQPSQFGIINSFLAALKIPAQPFLNSSIQVIPSIILITTWATVGYNMVLFLAGLGGIPSSFYEAAKIDGANSWQLFWKITWPLLSPTVLFTTVTGSIGAMQIFSIPYILTQGGPEDASRMVVMWIYQTGFNQFRMGYASSLAMVFFVIVMILTVFQLRFLRTRWSY
ncbi:MAG: sugar ABC transporter permease [Anaerolineaceae bacterium]|jgi:multiple sugar transport system permease protein